MPDSQQCQLDQVITQLGDAHAIMGAVIDMKTGELHQAYDNLSGGDLCLSAHRFVE